METLVPNPDKDRLNFSQWRIPLPGVKGAAGERGSTGSCSGHGRLPPPQLLSSQHDMMCGGADRVMLAWTSA